MKKVTIRFTLALMLALLLVAVMAVPALADNPGSDKAVLTSAVTAGGNRLLATQGPAIGTIPYNWEWVVGDGNFDNANLQGITASGLLAAFEKTGKKSFLTGAKNAGNTLKQRYAAAPTVRPYAQDVSFLVNLYKDTRDKSYFDTAKNWYAVMTTDFTAAANVDRLITARGGSMAGWDVAAQIRAANDAGFRNYARGMADQLIARSADWVHVPSYGWDYTPLAFGSLLWALHDMGGYQAAINEYRTFLLGAQGTDGSWDGGDFQTTAYVMIGLDEVKGWGKALNDALSAAGDFLLGSQTADGGWSYTGYGEYPEVDSEVIMALVVCSDQSFGLHGKGLRGPFGWFWRQGGRGHGPGR